ncbi:MAG: TerB family tellurite resistance protein [Deltaproteobacteria bacterium]|nr:TerB family tellurite resistance protein [Deltaproteobacteria bacterium]
MNIKDKIQICKVVTQAILADAQITDSERSFIEKLMDKYELDEDQRKEVLSRNIGDDPAEMARKITSFESKNELIVELAMAVAVDGEISSSERALLDRVATVFMISKVDLELLLQAAIA